MVDHTSDAWGMAFDGHTAVVAVDGSCWTNRRAPEHALARFTVGRRIRARLVWYDPDAATPAEDDNAA